MRMRTWNAVMEVVYRRGMSMYYITHWQVGSGGCAGGVGKTRFESAFSESSYSVQQNDQSSKTTATMSAMVGPRRFPRKR